MWTLHSQQQQRGAQLPTRAAKGRRPGDVPTEAVAGREAQEHEHAALDVAGEMGAAGESPASPLENRHQDITPTATEARASWDEAVQPERRPRDKPAARDGVPPAGR